MAIKSAQEMMAERMLPMLSKLIPPDMMQSINLVKDQLPEVMGMVHSRMAEYASRLEAIERSQVLILNKLERILAQSDPAYTPDSFPAHLAKHMDDLPTASID